MNVDLVEKKRHYEEALATFLSRIEQDRNILAAVLVGSISDDTIWWKESIHLWIIEADGVTKRLKFDGENEDISRTLVEEGINIHADMIPRSRFRKMVEGSSRTAFSCNFFAKRELVYCDDASISNWFDKANTAATKDKEKALLATTTWTIHAQRWARKQFQIKKDLQLAKETVVWAAHSIAAMEIVRQGKVYEQEIIYKAIESKPELFQTIYLDVIAKKPTKKTLNAAIDAIDDFLQKHWKTNLKPVLDFLKKQNRIVPLTEIAEHFAYSQLYPWHLESACDWLEEQGLLEKLSTPFKLTKKSRVEVEEPAYLWMS